MAEMMSSADAQHLWQLRTQLAQMHMKEQQTTRIAEFQQAALMDTIDNVAALEAQNLKLRQSLLLALRFVEAETDNKAVKAKCSLVAGRMRLLPLAPATESGMPSAAVPQCLFAGGALEPEPAPSLSSLASRPMLSGGATAESHSSQEGLMTAGAASVVHGVPLQLGASRALALESDHSSEQTEEAENVSTTSRRAPKQLRDDSNLVWPANATTVLIRNMPPRSSMEDLLRAFPPDGSSDLVHLPFNIKTRRASSFATINFISAELAASFHARFHGQRLPHSTRSRDPLIIMPAKIQGLAANLAFLLEEKGVAEMRNPALLPRLYLTGAAAERLVSTGPKCIQQPDEPGQPHRLDAREVLKMLGAAHEL